MKLIGNTYDVIIVGSGIAGLSAALAIDTNCSVLLLTKDIVTASNSYLAQGGIAISIGDDVNSHIEDTLKAGHYTNDENIVRRVIANSYKVKKFLEEMDVVFDSTESGEKYCTREGGHSFKRVYHVKDQTGKAIINALYNRVILKANISLLENVMVTDMIIDHQEIYGVNTLESNKYYAPQVVLATGGIGQVYARTTNEETVTGDGISMAINADVLVEDLHLIQFHPTCLKGTSHLMTEALRGEGAILVDDNHSRIMENIHPMEDLAPRDVVVNRMRNLMTLGKSIYLDARRMDSDLWEKQFPYIDSICLSNGIDPRNDLIPVEPVEHYLMGGIKVDEYGKTSIKGLYAVGEVANTGFHGNNRLASNSLLEAVYFGLEVGKSIKPNICSIFKYSRGNDDNYHLTCSDLEKLRDVMNECHINKSAYDFALEKISKYKGKYRSNRSEQELINKCLVACYVIKERYENEKT